jgi:hypothetical protein
MEHLAAVVLTCLGALLSNVLVLGRTRLRQAQEAVDVFVDGELKIRETLRGLGRRVKMRWGKVSQDIRDFCFFDRPRLVTVGGWIAIIGIFWATGRIKHFFDPDLVFIAMIVIIVIGGSLLSLMIWGIPALAIALTEFIVSRVGPIALLISLGPYKLIRGVERELALERTCLALGALLLIAGTIVGFFTVF